MYCEQTEPSPSVPAADVAADGRIPTFAAVTFEDVCPIDDDPGLDIGAYGDLNAVAKKRANGRASRVQQPRNGANQDHTSPSPVVELVLYTSAASTRSLRALRAVQEVLSRFEHDQVRLEIVDLAGNPDGGDEDAVVFTPTLVKRGPGPRTYIVGNLDDPNLVVELLELHGVARRGDWRM
jgi:circadian clock protein KaiB